MIEGMRGICIITKRVIAIEVPEVSDAKILGILALLWLKLDPQLFSSCPGDLVFLVFDSRFDVVSSSYKWLMVRPILIKNPQKPKKGASKWHWMCESTRSSFEVNYLEALNLWFLFAFTFGSSCFLIVFTRHNQGSLKIEHRMDRGRQERGEMGKKGIVQKGETQLRGVLPRTFSVE